MKIDVLLSDPLHPVVPVLEDWIISVSEQHEGRLLFDVAAASGGDVLFLVSCGQIVGSDVRARYGYVLVLHASDLPEGRGWSPHVWAILDGVREITITLLDAADPVDTGDIWAKLKIPVDPGWLHDEINASLFNGEVQLMNDWLKMISDDARPTPQPAEICSGHRRRTPADSELDPRSPIAEQFNLLRVADPVRFPAFFRLHGGKYKITLERMEDEPR
ncbi:MAG: UDP-glucuronic acid dehydrogenase [Planctomycetes bacterium]|nr:UDP-glucuronic acid dehydrogenase [Planctomycetota bacterium]